MDTVSVTQKLQTLLDRLQAKKVGAEWMAMCPAHPDGTASLAISESDGRILLHCHAGCSFDAVCAALEIQPRDLFQEPSSPRVIAEYDYTDESGALLYQ